MKYYVVDAFTSELFQGNPAGICLLEHWIDDSIMQNIATENNLAETAFLVGSGGEYELRWFTPKCEIDLCGHATLASAFVLMNTVEKGREVLRFSTASGILTVTMEDGKLKMNFPSRKPKPTAVPENLEEFLGTEVLETHAARDLLVLVRDEETVRNLTPDIEKLKIYRDYFGIVVTAKGSSCDFVSRYFVPNAGIPEDPVTGSTHSILIPFWSERLNQTELFAKQLSRRGGCLYCKDCGDRVEISGTAKLYLSGEILPEG